jgi:hypothetical protein
MLRRKSSRSVIPLLAMSLITTSCGNDDDAAAEAEGDVRPDVATLDVETLEAETESGTVQAQRAKRSFVAALGEGRAIGIASLAEEGDVEFGDVVVYVYDGDRAAAMAGELDPSGM